MKFAIFVAIALFTFEVFRKDFRTIFVVVIHAFFLALICASGKSDFSQAVASAVSGWDAVFSVVPLDLAILGIVASAIHGKLLQAAIGFLSLFLLERSLLKGKIGEGDKFTAGLFCGAFDMEEALYGLCFGAFILLVVALISKRKEVPLAPGWIAGILIFRFLRGFF